MPAVVKEPTAKAAKIHLPLTSLQQALAKISPALPSASHGIPVLRNVKIEDTTQGTTFTATDLDLSVRCTFPRMQDAAAPLLVSSERLMNYVKLLDGDDVTITPSERRATLKCRRSTTQLPLDVAANYPQTSFRESSGPRIAQRTLLRLIRHTSFAISPEESRYMLNGALLKYAAGRLQMVATDGHRMAIYSAPFDPAESTRSHHLPAGLIRALTKCLEDSEDMSVTVTDDATAVALSVAGEMPVDIACRKLTGAFPNYEAAIPSGEFEVSVTVSAAEMVAALARCVAMSDRESRAVKLTIAPGSIQMHAVDVNAGETDEVIDATAAGAFEEFVIGFSGQYLIDALKVSTGNVQMNFAKADGETALLLTCEPEPGEEFKYVVMPLRV